MFRVKQRSGVTSTPASKSDVIPALSPEEVAQSTLVISDNGRHTFPFAETTVDRLEGTNAKDWVPVELNERQQLEIRVSALQAKPPPEVPQKTTLKSSTGMIDEHTRYLETELLRTKSHVQELKNRITELEEQVVELGGELRPLILK